MSRMLRLALVGFGCLLHAVVAAQALPDPTRPPSGARVTAEGPNAAAAASEPAPVLESVLIGRDRSMAVISGRRLFVGDRVGDARIVRITGTEVVLRSSEGQTTLKLFPQVEKRARTQAPMAGAASQPHDKTRAP